tara:strand:- start:2084 stop:2467 length:384 start_codon:yes stop_codon:yes gene_type:complete
MWKNTIKKKIFDETPEEMTDFMNVTPRMKQEAEKRKDSKFTDKELVDMDSLVMARKIDKENIEGIIKAISDYAYYGRELENSLKEKMPELGLHLYRMGEAALGELHDLGEEWREVEEQIASVVSTLR